MNPKYEYGDEVRLIRNVRNDGTYPGSDKGELLMRRGSVGCVYDVGTYLQDQLIYRVHFLDDGRTLGCREEELIPAAQPWIPNRFEFREHVTMRVALRMEGEIIAHPGDEGEITAVLRENPEEGIFYDLFINDVSVTVPEMALDAIESEVERDGCIG